jgi:methionyl-tRNA formyltransferase
MRRLVFFGMDGGFSTALLKALVASDLAPVLVVVGVPQPKTTRAPLVERRSPRSGGFFGWLAPPPTGAPVAQRELPPTTNLAELARAAGIEVLVTSDPDAVRARAIIHEVQPEAFVVAGFPCLLSPRVLELAQRGGLNVHPGRLPEERGPSPLFWALKAGRTKLGFAIHVLDEGEDTGDVVARGEYEIEPGTEGSIALVRCAFAAAPHLVRVTRGLLVGELVRIPQPKIGASRCPRPTFRDGRIWPDRPARDVFTFAGGCASAYSLFVEIAGDRFFVAKARSWDDRATLPAEYYLSGNILLLACQPGVVELELKPEGALFSAEY